MSNRNRDDREYEERQQALRNRQQSGSQQQGQYGRPRGNEDDDRDVQGNFSSGGYASQPSGSNRGYGSSQGSMTGSQHGSQYEPGYGSRESGYGLRGQESQGYGLQGYGSQGSQSYGPQSYGAPNTGAGSQGFGPEGYGTSMYEGPGGYESQSFGSQGTQGYGQGGSQREFGSQGHYRQQGSQGYGSQGYDTPDRDRGSMGLGQRHLQGGSFGQEFGRELQQRGQQWRNALEERSRFGYGYGEQGQQGFESAQGLRSSHRGLGPKNYTRSDERIREDLNERLTDADDIDARSLSIEVSNGVATLTGTVEQRWMKHRAEDIAESCSGVRDVNNQIRVQPSSQDTSHKESGTTSQKSSSSGSNTTSTQGSTTPSGSSSASGASTTGSGSSSTRSTGSGH